jgi:hypothetical protein
MSDYTPVTSDQAAFSATVGATAVTGGQLVEYGATDLTVIPALGVKRPLGVAAHDAPVGGRVTVYVVPGMIHETLVKSGVTIPLGAPVVPGTTAGTLDFNVTSLAAAAASGLLLGIALKASAAGDGTTVKARWIGI